MSNETWLAVDEHCPTCNAVTKEAKGLNRQNLKKLLSFKMDTQGMVIFFLFLMLMTFAYTTYNYMEMAKTCALQLQNGTVIPFIQNNVLTIPTSFNLTNITGGLS